MELQVLLKKLGCSNNGEKKIGLLYLLIFLRRRMVSRGSEPTVPAVDRFLSQELISSRSVDLVRASIRLQGDIRVGVASSRLSIHRKVAAKWAVAILTVLVLRHRYQAA
jgi:hypothetical protein